MAIVDLSPAQLITLAQENAAEAEPLIASFGLRRRAMGEVLSSIRVVSDMFMQNGSAFHKYGNRLKTGQNYLASAVAVYDKLVEGEQLTEKEAKQLENIPEAMELLVPYMFDLASKNHGIKNLSPDTAQIASLVAARALVTLSEVDATRSQGALEAPFISEDEIRLLSEYGLHASMRFAVGERMQEGFAEVMQPVAVTVREPLQMRLDRAGATIGRIKPDAIEAARVSAGPRTI